MSSHSTFAFVRIYVLGFLAALVIRVLYATIRWERINLAPEDSGLLAPEPQIFAFWHGRMLMLPRHYMRHRGSRRTARPYMLISRHGDGRLIAFAIRLLGIHSVAGSSTRGAVTAVLDLIRKADAGSDIGVTPDGPKGPRAVCKKGIAILAQKTGLPVYPLTYSTKNCWQLRSWDGMIIPKPFSRGVAIRGEPIMVGRDDDLEVSSRTIQDALNEITLRADRHWDAL
jgi:lysophospholipid acyltransferase (LPLAT)-like uncharacterized protein